MRTENISPLRPIRSVFLGPPGTEATLGLMLPSEISLFESNAPETTSVTSARQDHERFQEKLTENGIHVFNMRHILGNALAERAHHRFTSKAVFVNELLDRAMKLHQAHHMQLDPEQRLAELEALIDIDTQQMGLDAAIAINGVLTNILGIDGEERPFNPDLFPPLANFLFWRDTNHVTGGQLVTHRMHYYIRDQEVKLAELGFQALGFEYQQIAIEPSLRTNASGQKVNSESIEGGDVLPFELNQQLFSLIGAAERTSWEAVKAWFELHEHLFSASGPGIIPAVVEGPTSGTQDQMHIDTYVQQVAPGAIIHCGEITRARDFSILMRRGGEIVKVKPEDMSDGTFYDWIVNNAPHTYDMSREEQLNYAPNVLVDGSETGETTVYITRDGTPEVTDFIQQHAVKTVLLQMNDLTKFYGGAHCATSEIR